MLSTDDSIVAVATPPGRGGIGVVRISGPSSHEIAGLILDRRGPLAARRATLTRVRAAGHGGSREPLDEVVATYFPAPHSYTGEHVVEISAHGSPVVLQAIVVSAIEAGARLAEPGEFTLRAFLHGKRDLIQAEAVADLIAAATPLQARIAFDQLEGTLTQRIAAIDAELFDLIARLEASLDFPDEGYHFIEPAETARRVGGVVARLDQLLGSARRGRMIREGATVVIAGRPNVGKSSIFNILAGSDRAIVTAIPGTTRDLVTESIDLDGLPITLVDTAGWRETRDLVEREGVARGERAREVAGLLILVLDRSESSRVEDEQLLAQTQGPRRIVVTNKSDLPAVFDVTIDDAGAGGPISVSAKTGAGAEDLRRAIVRELTGSESLRDTAAISNVRHITLVEQARASLVSAEQAVAGGDTPEEFVLADLQAARASLEEIVGARTNEDLLQHIFEKFCVGK
ncbi:MAG: tRNA uridine-5-carboxymethylaminomethyl(34) synthesis GTPase MnmE [Acidobacteria bacterium]|nr:tRNA uridine-5-carboxymethylaminomethyl(34) synthesis GTPase MnmE [Acidobacteriota bacterium]